MNTDSSVSDSKRKTEMFNENDEISEYVLSHKESITDDEAVLKHYKKMKNGKLIPKKQQKIFRNFDLNFPSFSSEHIKKHHVIPYLVKTQ